jgi:hypothetical protein
MSIVYEPAKNPKESKKQKKEAIEEHFYGSILCVLVISGKYDDQTMETNSNNFLEFINTKLPPVGAHVVILDSTDPFCRDYSKNLFVNLKYQYEDVPIFVIKVNNGNLDDDDEADGQTIDIIPSYRDPKVIEMEELVDSFNAAYDLLDIEDKQSLINSIQEDEPEDAESIDESEGEEDDEPSIDEDTRKKIRDFVVGDDSDEMSTDSSVYSDDESDEETSSSEDGLGSDLLNLENELAEVTVERDKLLAVFAIRHKLPANTENTIKELEKKGGEKYEEYTELEDRIRKIKSDLKEIKTQVRTASNDEEMEADEWVPVAKRLRARNCKGGSRFNRPNNNAEMEKLASKMAKEFTLGDSETSDERSEGESDEEDESSEDERSEESDDEMSE